MTNASVAITDLEAIVHNKLTRLADLVRGKAWGVPQGKPRIYMPSCRGRKVFFSFSDWGVADETDLGGETFHVYIDDCGQASQWYASQRNLVLKAHQRHGLALQAAGCNEWTLAERIMKRGNEYTAEEVGDASRHLLNGRHAIAAKALNLEL